MRNYYISLIVAIAVGLICVLPQIIFIISLGDDYRGINLLRTPNEEGYIALMQEKLDGHPRVSSMPFFEYKNGGAPLLPMTLLNLYVAPVKLLGVSLGSVVIFSKFVFPSTLFFIVYLLLYELMKTKNNADNKSRIFFAITGGILIVLGFELVDYASMISYLKGASSPEGFLIWTRPVNPISGAILLFFYIYSLNKFNLQNKKKWIFWCGLSLALMMASYVFSWTLAVVVLGLYAFGSLIKKKWKIFFSYISILILAILFSLSYWINTIKASRMEWYSEAAARIGMFHTHAPHLNKFIFALIILFLVASIFALHKRILIRPLPYWWWFSIILLFSSVIVYNQQIITGMEIWYYHYIYYTIPFGYMVFMLLLWYIFHERYTKITNFLVAIILIVSTTLGIFYQISAYIKRAPEFAERQYYRDIFDFFNDVEKDCVILANEKIHDSWSYNIPAFTHCNLYYSSENQSVLTDPDDFYYRYLSVLRVRGVKGENIEEYILENKYEVENALQYQLQRILGFPDLKLEQRMLSVPEDYRNLVEQDFYSQLSRFRIDYILSEGELDKAVLEALPNLKKVESIHEMIVYSFLE